MLFSPGTEARKQCWDYTGCRASRSLRLIRVQLKGGETEVLATSLLDEETHLKAWFKRLYHLCWGVEDAYKREKTRLEIENFSGLSPRMVQQDFYAKIFVLNLCVVLSWVAQAIAIRRYQTRKQTYRVNFANALSKMKDNVVRLFLIDSPLQLLTALVLTMAASVEAVRPDRSYPRKIKTAKLHGFRPNDNRCR